VDVTPAPSFAVVGARLDQSMRAGLDAETANRLQGHTEKAQQFLAGPNERAGIAQLDAAAASLQDRPDQQDMAQVFSDLAGSLR
jgi:hypothetical protein